MLIELRVRDYAVIEEAHLRFDAGLTVLTGETGAGKSLIVGALSLLLGERASSEAVRAGADRSRVEAVFDVEGRRDVAGVLDAVGLTAEDDHLVLARDVSSQGRSRAWVNGSPTTVGTLRRVGAHLVDLHGQHEHRTLIRRSRQRELLDAFAGVGSLAGELEVAYERVRNLTERRDAWDQRIREIEGRADFVRFQLNEIEAAAPDPGEEEGLRAEAHRLEHADELAKGAEVLRDDLYEGDDAVHDRLHGARDTLRRMARMDPSLEQAARAVEEALTAVTEASRELTRYAGGLEADPSRLEWLRERLDGLARLKRKYGPELADVVRAGERLGEELAELDRSDLERSGLDGEIERAEALLIGRAAELTRARDRGARGLSGAVQNLLPDLGLEGATFQILLERLPTLGPHGAESVEFRAALNRGFEPRSLARVASGGELARVLLAIETVLAEVDEVPTLVFDEVDAGVGGAVAGAVAGTLHAVSRSHQVFVVTHLPQVASRADHHLSVEKERSGERTATRVRALTGEPRVAEIARMLGGDPESSVSRDHARELLAAGGARPES